MPVLEVVKSQKWGVGSPTVVTYIHRLSSPPPPGTNPYLNPTPSNLLNPDCLQSELIHSSKPRTALHQSLNGWFFFERENKTISYTKRFRRLERMTRIKRGSFWAEVLEDCLLRYLSASLPRLSSGTDPPLSQSLYQPVSATLKWAT